MTPFGRRLRSRSDETIGEAARRLDGLRRHHATAVGTADRRLNQLIRYKLPIRYLCADRQRL
jgi:hypothetical protein